METPSAGRVEFRSFLSERLERWSQISVEGLCVSNAPYVPIADRANARFGGRRASGIARVRCIIRPLGSAFVQRK